MANTLLKWDFERHCYDEVENILGLSVWCNIGDIVKCANCKRIVLFDDTYTSHQWHNAVGFGYPVCEECFEAEKLLEKKYRNLSELI